MTSILVFGATGQVGQELASRARKRGISLVAVPRASLDIADPKAVGDMVAASAASLVVNAAAYTKVDLAETAQEEAFRANALGPGVIAEACAAARCPLLHLSTDYVFDGTKPTPYSETDPIAPLGVYGRSKALGEQAVRDRLDQHVILRSAWIYGIYGENFLKTMLKLAQERDELRVVADQRGNPTGSADIAEAILTIAPRLQAREPIWGTYHFAGTDATTWHGFATEIVAAQAGVSGRRPAVVPITTAEFPTAARRPANSELDCAHFAATFGFRAADWRTRTRDVVKTLLNGRGPAT
jgi:dTDP-4-dehydrorhamnose reductase